MKWNRSNIDLCIDRPVVRQHRYFVGDRDGIPNVFRLIISDLNAIIGAPEGRGSSTKSPISSPSLLVFCVGRMTGLFEMRNAPVICDLLLTGLRFFIAMCAALLV